MFCVVVGGMNNKNPVSEPDCEKICRICWIRGGISLEHSLDCWQKRSGFSDGLAVIWVVSLCMSWYSLFCHVMMCVDIFLGYKIIFFV